MRFTANGKLNPGEFWSRSKSPDRNRAFCARTFVCSVAFVASQRVFVPLAAAAKSAKIIVRFCNWRKGEGGEEHDPLNKPQSPSRWKARRIESTSFRSSRDYHFQPVFFHPSPILSPQRLKFTSPFSAETRRRRSVTIQFENKKDIAR